MSDSINSETIDNSNPPLCQCGFCNEYVKWNKGKKKWAKYVKGHAVKAQWKNPEIRKSRSIGIKQCWDDPEYKAKRSPKTRDVDITEIHYCLCGCGQLVYYDKQHCKWNRYVKGHYKTHRKNYPIGVAPHCYCGCGAKTEWNQKKNRWNKLADHDNQSPEYKAYFASNAKAKWDNPEYKQSIVETQKKRCNTSEHKEKVRQQSITNWQNSEYRDNLVTQLKYNYNRPEYVEMISKRTKDLWATPKFRKKVLSKLTSPEMRNQISESVKKYYKINPEHRNLIAEKNKKIWQNPIYKQNQIRKHKEAWQNDELKTRMLIAQQKTPNKPESIINALTPDYIEYVGNRAWWRTLKVKNKDGNIIVRHKNPDFLIRHQHKVIEINGMYWHRQDIFTTESMIEAWKQIGYDLLVIWDYELKEDINKVLNKIADFVGEQSWQMSLNI